MHSMQLPSRLSTSTLGDLLGALHRQGTTGLLELCELWTPGGRTVPGRQHRIQLLSGLVTAVDTPLPAPRLGEILARHGRLGEDTARRMAPLSRAGRPLGEVLVAAGLVPRKALDEALRAQLRARLDAVFGLEEATICFHTARPLADALRRLGPLDPHDFLHGRPRARDRRSGARAGAPIGAAAGRAGDARRRALRVLGLDEGASEADVRRAFRRLAARAHPDRTGGAGAARFAELSAAYHLLVA